MIITVVQPQYFSGDNPDENIAKFLLDELEKIPENSLVVLPEYSNAGGLSDPDKEISALPRAKRMLDAAKQISKSKKSYVAVNVLEERLGKIKNSTYLFNREGNIAFIYDKQHLPPSEISLGVEQGNGTGKVSCTCEVDGIRFAFMTCYDVYFNEQIEYIASFKPDVILIPGYQRGERVDIIHAQAKLTAFRCNAFIARSSYSMGTDERGGCSMIVAPNGEIIKNIGADIGSVSADVDVHEKYLRTAGFGGALVRNDEFIEKGLCPDAFK